MAVQFTTNGDSLANATNATFFSTSTAPQSINVWINALWDGNVKTSSYVGMYNGVGGPSAIQFGSKQGSPAGQCDIWTWGGGVLVSTTGVVIPSNTWVNLCYTYDGTTHRLYYNGVLNNTGTTAQIVGNFNQVFLNGYTTGVTNETATFQVDTYYYYNRVLSADEIATIHSARGNRHGIVYGSLLRYEFDEGVQGATVTSIRNQTTYPLPVSDLVSNSARTPTVTYSPGAVSSNLRVPLGCNG